MLKTEIFRKLVKTMKDIKPLDNNEKSQYDKAIFAGGCFWCMVAPFDTYPGVIKVESGYTGGVVPNPTYEQVCTGLTGHTEAVRITYDPNKLSYEDLVNIYWQVTDPTDAMGQFQDRGSQYQPVIYYNSPEQKEIAEQSRKSLEDSNKFSDPIVTRIEPAKPFYLAEDYHQDYLKKNPSGYCHIDVTDAEKPLIDASNYEKSSQEVLKKSLTEESYRVTQEAATEAPFTNAYDQTFEEGIYVDITTGEPLFFAKDKFASGCGWPSFSRPISKELIHYYKDLSHGMERIEVRSRSGDAHLGHVFTDGPRELGGLRYCINSASLCFVAKDEMEEEGYGYLLPYLNK